MTITKLDVAEREIVAAVRLLFDGGDCVPVLVLAAAARAITTTLCVRRGLPSFVDLVLEDWPHLTKRDIYREVNRHANFFKHADADPDEVLTTFLDHEAECVLFAAVIDLNQLCGRPPAEALVFEDWFHALLLSDDEPKRGLDEMFPNLQKLPRAQQLQLGKQVLELARTTPEFETPSQLARVLTRRAARRADP
jgi:hypothetical protein